MVFSLPGSMTTGGNGSYERSLLSSLQRLKEDQQLTDVVLMLPDQSTINCHQVVLRAASLYFDNILKETQSKEIKVDFADESIIRAVIRYFYSGQIEINENNLHDLLAVSQILHLEDLNSKCESF